MSDPGRGVLFLIAALTGATAAPAQTVPFADTEDATLARIDVDDAKVHPILSVDGRNGDYARGAYDDDDAGPGRIPVHLAVGGVVVLHRDAARRGTVFLMAQSSNGFHAPRRDERAGPRAWYESNNLIGLAWRPADGVDAAVTYAIKTSPNGVAPTSHEASLTFLHATDGGIGRLRPRVAITRRTKGEGGVYTILGIAPSVALSDGEDATTLGLPVTVGIGWHGFYAAGSGDRIYGSGGVTLDRPLRLGGIRATLQAAMLGLIRDDRLRRLDSPGGTTASIVPHATLSVAFVW